MGVGGDVADKLLELCDLRAQAWIDRVKPYLYAVAYRVTRDRQHAEDAVMSAFAVVLHTKSLPREDGCVLTWLTKITVQRSSQLARSQRRASVESLEFAMSEDPNLEASLREAGASGESSRSRYALEVAAAVSRLPREQRLALELVGVNDLTFAEVAELLEISEAAVKNRVDSAKKRVTEILLNRDLFLSVGAVELILAGRAMAPPSQSFLLRDVRQVPKPPGRLLPYPRVVMVSSLAVLVAFVAMFARERIPPRETPNPGGLAARDGAPPIERASPPPSSVEPVRDRTAPRVVALDTVVTGRVVYRDGSPAAGAEVRVTASSNGSRSGYAGPASMQTVMTSLTGEYIAAIPEEATSVSVLVRQGPYWRAEVPLSRSRQGETASQGFGPGVNHLEDVTLTPRGAVRGTVKTADGVPVADAVVRVVSHVQAVGNFALTSEDGSYEIGEIHPGPYKVRVIKDLVTRDGDSVVIAEAGTLTGVDVTLDNVYWQDVKVQDAQGAPVSGATLSDETTEAVLTSQWTTDDAGARRILAPSKQESVLNIRDEATRAVTFERLGPSPMPSPLTITLPALAPFAVTCIDARTGAAVRAFRVCAMDSNGLNVAPFTAGDSGAAVVKLWTKYLRQPAVLWVQAPGFADALHTLDLTVPNPTVLLERGVRVIGRVTAPNGAPIPRALVGVTKHRELIRRAVTDAEGYYVLENVPRWADEVSAWVPDRPRAGVKLEIPENLIEFDAGVVAVAAGCQVTFHLPADAPTGVNLEILRAPAEGENRALSFGVWVTLVPGESRTVACLPPGECSVRRILGILGRRQAEIVLERLSLRDGESRTVVLAGPEPSEISGTVKPVGIPPELLEVLAVRTDAPVVFGTRVDGQGNFSFRSLPPGFSYVLTCRFLAATTSLQGDELLDFWKSSLSMIGTPSLGTHVAVVAAGPGKQPPVHIQGSLLTASADLTALPRTPEARLEIYANSFVSRSASPWLVSLDTNTGPTLGLPAGSYLVRVFDGERLLGELASTVKNGQAVVWRLPD
jgi:RNA polymerase sigma-70 factor (ECF subfamily)